MSNQSNITEISYDNSGECPNFVIAKFDAHKHIEVGFQNSPDSQLFYCKHSVDDTTTVVDMKSFINMIPKTVDDCRLVLRMVLDYLTTPKKLLQDQS